MQIQTALGWTSLVLVRGRCSANRVLSNDSEQVSRGRKSRAALQVKGAITGTGVEQNRAVLRREHFLVVSFNFSMPDAAPQTALHSLFSPTLWQRSFAGFPKGTAPLMQLHHPGFPWAVPGGGVQQDETPSSPWPQGGVEAEASRVRHSEAASSQRSFY